jgi:hypothetical protein
MGEHERIWLEPAPGADEDYGQQWCQDNVWGDDAIEYVRADLVASLPTKADYTDTRGQWRVFEDINPGWRGIEIEGDNDADPILYPQKISRERLDRIVSAHNAALSPNTETAP